MSEIEHHIDYSHATPHLPRDSHTSFVSTKLHNEAYSQRLTEDFATGAPPEIRHLVTGLLNDYALSMLSTRHLI
jgi:hypothetical protein